MNKKFFKVISILISVMILLSVFSGCSQNNSDKKPEQSAANETSKKEEAKAAPAEKTKLVVRTLHPDGDPFKKNLQDCIDQFNKSNKYNVNFEIETIIGGDPYKTKVRADMAAGNGPDVFYWWTVGDMIPFANSGKVVDFNKYLDADSTWKGSFQSGVLDTCSLNGKVYSIPSGLAIAFLYYNTEIFAKYNLTAPKTYADLVNIVKVLKKNNETPFAVGGKDAWLPSLTASYLCLRIAGKDAFNKVMNDKKGFYNDDFLKGFKAFKELKDLDAFEKGCLTNDYTASENLFMNGKAAMRVMINNEVGVFASDKSAVKGKFSICPFPAVDGGKGDIGDFTGMTDQNLAVSSNSKNVDAAADFVKLFTGTEYQKKNVELAGLIPTTKVQYDQLKVDPMIVKAIQMLNEAKSVNLFPDVILGPQLGGSDWDGATQAIVAGGDPEKLLKKVEDAAAKAK